MRKYDCNRGVEGDVGVGQDVAYIFQFCVKQRRNSVFRGAAVHFLCALAESKIDLSLIGGETMNLMLLHPLHTCMAAFGRLAKEGSILA